MGIEWISDVVTISPFPENKLKIIVPQRKKPYPLFSLPPGILTGDPTENLYPFTFTETVTENDTENDTESGRKNVAENATETFAHGNEATNGASKNFSRLLLSSYDSFLGSSGGENGDLGFILSERTEDMRAHYRMGREIGRGHFGVVRECEKVGTAEMAACKSIYKESLKQKEEIQELQAEICIMERVQDHPNVVQLRDVFEDSEAVHLLMELCEEGDLFDHIARKKRLPEPEAAKIFSQAVLAVRHCHSRGVIHRDLKPENLMLQTAASGGEAGFTVKLGDFGLAVVAAPGELVTGLAGSPFYMAPEIVGRKPYGREVDVWSLGVVLYTALSGFLPFWGNSHEETFAAIGRGNPDFVKKPWQKISPEAKSLVRKMLTPDPKKRVKIDDILTHPWVLSHCPPSLPMTRPISITQNPSFPSLPSFSFQSVRFPPWSPKEYGESPIPQALSAPKGQFSPPRTPSPQASPRNMPPKPSISLLPFTPPGTPKKEGETSHVTLFAATLANPFRFFQHPSQEREREREKEEREGGKREREGGEREREGGEREREGGEREREGGEREGREREREVEEERERIRKHLAVGAERTSRPFVLSEVFEKFSKREVL